MKRKGAMLLAILLAVSNITACSKKPDVTVSGNNEVKSDTNKGVSDNTKDKLEDLFGNSDNGNKRVVNASTTSVTFNELMNKYSNMQAAGGVSIDNTVSPIYNVDRNAKFTFHFNSKVDPFQAVTVHTDRACGVNSTMFTKNRSYFTEDGGIDVIVGNWTTPVLNAEDRLDYTMDTEDWGYAGRYYLSINYDMDANVPTKLENPIVIPFTVASSVEVPQLGYKITTDGEFVLNWTDSHAEKYKIYRAYASTKRPNSLEREYAYTGIHLSCIAEVPGNVLEYKLEDSATTMTNSEYGVEYQAQQNVIGDDIYFVTAVRDGKESNFGLEVSLYKYLSQLPCEVEEDFNSGYGLKIDIAGAELPNELSVKMKDGSIAKYPVDYKLLKVETWDTDMLDNTAVYFYKVRNTKLTGLAFLNIGKETSADEVVESKAQTNAGLYETKLDVTGLLSEDIPVLSDVSNSDIDLTKIKEYNPNSRVVYNQDALSKRIDLELARIITNGEYTSDPNSIIIADYNDRQNNLQEREKQLGDIFKVGGNTEVESTRETEKQLLIESEAETLFETETEIETEVETLFEIETETEEETLFETETETEVETEADTEAETLFDVDIEDNTDTNITADNIIEKKLEDDKKRIEDGDDIEFNVPSKYVTTADSVEEEYLALSLIEQNKEIRIDVLPYLLDPDYLCDVVYKVVYQNPYILGINSLDVAVSDDSEVYLVVGYTYDDEEAAAKQAEIALKVDEVSSSIYKASMTDEEKVFATWKYLEDNAHYDDECLEYLEQNDFYVAPGDDYPYKDSSSAYGILCKGVGVCASYAATTKLLLTNAGVDTDVMLGYLDKTFPHAWNAVKLDNNWYQIDITNNYTNAGIPYYLYNASTAQASDMAYVLDDRWELDDVVYAFNNPDNSKEWYTANGLVAGSKNELKDAIIKGWKETEYDCYAVKSKIEVSTSNEDDYKFLASVYEALVESGELDVSELENTGMISSNGYVIVVKDIEKFYQQ